MNRWTLFYRSLPAEARGPTILYFLRDDLSKKLKSQKSEFEAFWLEMVGSANENIVVGVTYRQPRPKQTQFLKYLKNTKK